jgi:hypothetical protein
MLILRRLLLAAKQANFETVAVAAILANFETAAAAAFQADLEMIAAHRNTGQF